MRKTSSAKSDAFHWCPGGRCQRTEPPSAWLNAPPLQDTHLTHTSPPRKHPRMRQQWRVTSPATCVHNDFPRTFCPFTCLLPFPKNLLPLSLHITQTCLLIYSLCLFVPNLHIVWTIWASLILIVQVLPRAYFCFSQGNPTQFILMSRR